MCKDSLISSSIDDECSGESLDNTGTGAFGGWSSCCKRCEKGRGVFQHEGREDSNSRRCLIGLATKGPGGVSICGGWLGFMSSDQVPTSPTA